MDPRGFKVWPIAAPRDVDKERHFLYRFWYARVLVERVEHLATKEECGAVTGRSTSSSGC